MTSSETNLQTAIKFGVATYETCVVLNWKGNTKLHWCKNYYGSFLVKTLQEVRLLCEKHGESYLIVLCEAPQMHEIAQELPEEILVDAKYDNEIDILFLLNVCKNSISYETNNNIKEGCSKAKGFDEKCYVSIEKYHYAQAYAELYIELRDAGMLKNIT